MSSTHAWADAYTQENNQHFHKCTVDGCTATDTKVSCSGGTATCQEKAKCSVCGNEYGEKSATHAWATSYTQENNQHFHMCTVPGCTATDTKVNCSGGTATCQAKAECSVCHKEYGTVDATNHVETEIKDAVEATCGDAGYTGDTYCKSCKIKIAEGEEIDATGNHDFQNGICTECGEDDPTYVPEDTEEAFTKVTTPTSGKEYVIVINGYGMTSTATTFQDQSNTYNALAGTEVEIAENKITSSVTDDMIWKVTISGNKYTIQNTYATTYLSCNYDGSSNRKLELSTTADSNWTYTDSHLRNSDHNNGAYLAEHEGNFCVRSNYWMDSKPQTFVVEFYEVGTGTTVEPEQPGDEEKPVEGEMTKVTELEDGRYVIAVGNYGLTTETGSTEVSSGNWWGSATTTYNGLKAKGVTVEGNAIVDGVTDDMIWEVSISNGAITLKNESTGKYLDAAYKSSNSGTTTRVFELVENGYVAWTYSGADLYTKKTDTDAYVALVNNAIFSVRGSSNKSAVDFYRVGPAKQVTGIEIKTAPTKLEYIVGQSFNASGLVLEVTYEDGTKGTVSGGFTVEDGTNLTLEQNSVTITYKGQSVTQEITVRERTADDESYIGFTSDMHDETGNLRNWLTGVQNAVDPDLEHMAFGGDFTYNRSISSFNEAVKIVNELVGKDKGVYTTGNHEYDNSSVAQQMASTPGFKRIGLAADEINYDIYCVGAADTGANYGTFNQSDRTTLENYLKDAPKDEPIFIVTHWPLHYISGRTTTGASEMIDLLNKYPNVVFLWGHNHSQNSESHYGEILTAGDSIKYTSSSSKDIKFTYANAGAMKGDQKPYYGLVASVSGTGDEVTLQYYNVNGQTAGNAVTIEIAEHKHNMKHVDEKPATCTQEGNIEHYVCDGCGKYFEDADGNKTIQSIVIAVIPHQVTVNNNGYTWNEKYTECTATGTCSVGEHQVTATTSAITKTVVKAPTCEADGTTTHKATFSGNDAWAGTNTATETVGKIGHSYGAPTYEWADDNSTCTAKKVCGNDATHIDSVTKNSTIDTDKTKAPTCGEDGVTVYVVVFDVIGLVKQEKPVNVAATGEHSFDETKWATNADMHWHECTVCDAKTDEASHTPNVDQATEQTAKYCTKCNFVIEEPKDHTHKPTKTEGQAASCTADGWNDYYTCTCGKNFSDAAGKNVIGNLEAWKTGAGKISALNHSEKVYNAQGNKLTETCDLCKTELGTATITCAGGEYKNAAYKATVTGTGTLANQNWTISYNCEDGCKNAGEHTAFITMGGATANVKFTISKKSVTGATVGSFAAMTYTGSAQTPTANVTIDGVTITGTWSSVTNVSDKTTFTASGNFEGTIADRETGMKKAASVLTAAPAAMNGLVYTGEAQALVNPGTATGGTMQYKINGGAYSANIPAAVDAGEYTVYYKVVGDDNHEDIAERSFKVTIAAAQTPEQPVNAIKLNLSAFADNSVVWVDGVQYTVDARGENSFVDLPEGLVPTNMVVYNFHVGDSNDVHTQYPVSMKVWALKKYEDGYYHAEHISALDNILQYSGSSIRITGTKGIRMITSVESNKKSALTSNGLAGYKLVEYGTVLAQSSKLAGNKPLTLGHDYAKSNYAYKRGVADPIFAYSGNLVQYTNVLVGFNMDQCKEDIAMRPYMILEDAAGKQMTIYGGIVYRSIGYIAYQNRDAFQAGSTAYEYVWEIIKHVYGNKYNAEYKG